MQRRRYLIDALIGRDIRTKIWVRRGHRHQLPPSWHIVGDWFDNCSCAVPCPCTFAQAPDNGFCELVLFWRVREGHYGDVKLDNFSFVRVGRWEGDLWARKAAGVAGLYIDDHADDRQMEALPAIIGGRAGGFRFATLRARGTLYLSSHTSSKRQLLKTLLTTRLRPFTRGRQQVAARV